MVHEKNVNHNLIHGYHDPLIPGSYTFGAPI